MKEWANKPTALLTTSSSTVKTVSSNPVGSAGSAIVKTSSSSVTLTSGSSTTITSTSSGAVSSTLSQRAAAGVAVAAPLTAGTIVGGIAAVFYGVSNIKKYKGREKNGKQAVKDTLKDSTGLGVSAGLGVAAAHAVVGTAFALGSTLIVPVTAGIATGYVSMKIWNKIFRG